jgi:hypothetical protein
MNREPARRTLLALPLPAVLASCGLPDNQQTSSSPSPSPGTRTSPNPVPGAAQTLPPGRPGTPRGLRSPTPDAHRDATTTGEAALTLAWSHDTRLDTSPHDATVRMARAGWCTPRYRDTLLGQPVRAGAGPTWAEWAAHRAYTTVALRRADEAGRPPDTPVTAYRQWRGTLTPHGARGGAGPRQELTAYLVLRRGRDGWQVADMQVRDA